MSIWEIIYRHYRFPFTEDINEERVLFANNSGVRLFCIQFAAIMTEADNDLVPHTCYWRIHMGARRQHEAGVALVARVSKELRLL